jgi:glycosyltransferase involved in cell wall biosynthesis
LIVRVFKKIFFLLKLHFNNAVKLASGSLYLLIKPAHLPRIIFTVTNDLTYDQRMHRIAGSLAGQGYDVLLVGRKLKTSITAKVQPFLQKRLSCFFTKGFLFYKEYNLRLFIFLLFQKADIICAIDLDTILPVYFVTLLKKQKRVYDAHELFTEQKEIITRPFIHSIWLAIERFAVPKFKKGYTVNEFIASELLRRYGVNYAVIKNLPRLSVLPSVDRHEKWILYQGSVNEGRCFETLLPAMKEVNARLVICGRGNFFEQAKELISKHQLEKKVALRGYLSPDELNALTPSAYIGITLFEAKGLNQYYSLANRFFDYPMAGIPQVCVNYPEYAAINKEYHIAYLVDDTRSETIAAALNKLISDDVLYAQLRANCLHARTVLNWENEQQTLFDFYNSL